MDKFGLFPYILISAAICFTLRLAPFIIFRDEASVPPVIRYVGRYLPPAIVTGIVIYCIKDINITVFPYAVKEICATALVIALHLWKRNTLLSVFAGTAAYMFLVQAF